MKKEVAVLDIGTSTICSAIVNLSSKEKNSSLGLGDEIRVVGVGNRLAKGIKFGTISNFEELEESILESIASAEEEAKKTIKSLFISIPTWAIQSHIIESSTDIGQTPIDDIHMASLLKFDTTDYIEQNREVIHIFPIAYSVDETYNIQDPKGMIGKKLSAVFLVITAPTLFLKNIKSCLNRNNIDVSGFTASTYASGLSVVLREEFLSGVTIVDIGGTTTSIACFQNGILLYIDYIRSGSQNITNDISKVLKISRYNAERFKRLYGVSGSIMEDEQFLITRIDEYGETCAQKISRQTLDEIISARLEDILKKAQEHVYNCIMDKSLYQTIIITGGGSQLSGLSEFIRLKKYFNNSSVRLGKPIGTTGSHDLVKSQEFACVAGTALCCEKEISAKDIKLSKKSIFQKVMLWFKRGI